MNWLIKKLRENAKLPTNKKGDAGWDCYISAFKYHPKSEEFFSNRVILRPGFDSIVCCLGFAAEFDYGYHANLMPRSGLGAEGIVPVIGTIDPSYRGEWMAMIQKPVGCESYELKVGDKICQVIFHKDVEVNQQEVYTLSVTTRGEGGFGSTGK